MEKRKTERGFALIEVVVVMVVIGLLAAIAIPGLTKVRMQSQEKEVMKNLQKIAEGGQQYILENGVKDAVSVSELEDVYFSTIRSIAGETYEGLQVAPGGGKLVVAIKEREVVYSY